MLKPVALVFLLVICSLNSRKLSVFEHICVHLCRVIKNSEIRKITHDLRIGAEDRDRKSLILSGARQVGKTAAVDIFLEDFARYIYLNLGKEEDAEFFSRGWTLVKSHADHQADRDTQAHKYGSHHNSDRQVLLG